MNNFIDLLKDNIINKSDLVIKRHEYLGLDATQAAFLAKIFVNNEQSYNNLRIEDIAELMDVNIDTANVIIEKLITDGYLLLSNCEDGNGHLFNFDTIIEKLMMSYSSPLASDSIERKLDWINEKVSFELTNENKDELIKILNNIDWNVAATAIAKFIDQDKQTFPLLVSFFQTISISDTGNERVKSILKHNWLLD